MIILEPSFEILTPINKSEIYKKLELAGRVCYKSENLITEDSAAKFVEKIAQRHHESVLEHHSITVKFITDRGCCYTPNTKVLTEMGWKYIQNVQKNEKVYTLDDSNNVVLEPVQKVIYQPYIGYIYKFRTTQMDLSVTPKHAMWIYDYHKRSETTKTWKLTQAKDMHNTRYLFDKHAQALIKEGQTDEYITIPGVSRPVFENSYTYLDVKYRKKYFYELLGLWVTDGCLCKGNYKSSRAGKICITQVKPRYRKRIEFLLDKLNIKYHKNNKNSSYYIYNTSLFSWLKQTFIQKEKYKKSYYIRIPPFILADTQYIKWFLLGCFEGDGTRMADGRRMLYSASYGFLEDVNHCLFKLGICSNINVIKRKNNNAHYINGNLIKNRVKAYVLNIVNTQYHLYNKNKDTFAKKIYIGMVTCLTLEKYHKLYVMCNGKPCWSGNSHEAVRHRLASYSQESSRYCSYNKDKFSNQISVIKPDNIKEGSSEYNMWKSTCEACEMGYFALLNNGVTPENARSVLPTCLKTEIVVTANLREWKHIFEMRCAEVAHPDIRKIMIPLRDEFRRVMPEIFGEE